MSVTRFFMSSSPPYEGAAWPMLWPDRELDPFVARRVFVAIRTTGHFDAFSCSFVVRVRPDLKRIRFEGANGSVLEDDLRVQDDEASRPDDKIARVLAFDHDYRGRASIAAQLERLAADVRSGRIDAVAVAAVVEGESVGTFFGQVEKHERPFLLLGAMRYLESRLLDWLR